MKNNACSYFFLKNWTVKVWAILMCLFLLNATSALSQQPVRPKLVKSKKKNFRIIPLPAVGATPTTGFAIGVAPGAYWHVGNSDSTSESNALGTLIFTSKKQILSTLKGITYFDKDQWYLLTDMRFFVTSQPTYGLGTGPQSSKPIGGSVSFPDYPFNPILSSQMMKFNYLRVHNTLMRRHKKTRLFYGLGYQLDYHFKIDDQLLDLDTFPPTYTSHFLYSELKGFDRERYTTSGITFNILQDSRDNAANPYSGYYAFINLRVNPVFLGSSKNSGLLWMEYRNYFNLSQKRLRHLIGIWLYGWFQTWGDLPYLDLPAVGWDQFGRSGRAYVQGRFRGQDIIYTEVEYRVPLQRNKDTFGAVVFVNATTASNRNAGISLYDYMDFGYGVGLRLNLFKNSRANVTIDYAWGEYGAQGIYFGLNEAF